MSQITTDEWSIVYQFLPCRDRQNLSLVSQQLRRVYLESIISLNFFPPAGTGLDSILGHGNFSNLRVLQLHQLSSEGWLSLSRYCPILEDLSVHVLIPAVSSFSEPDVGTLHSLRTLRLSRNVTKELGFWVGRTPQLESLRFSRQFSEAVMMLAAHVQQDVGRSSYLSLSTLTFDENLEGEQDGENIVAFLRACPSLTSLTCPHDHREASLSFRDLARVCGQNLKRLDLRDGAVIFKLSTCAKQFPCLESLGENHTYTTYRDLMKSFPLLKPTIDITSREIDLSGFVPATLAYVQKLSLNVCGSDFSSLTLVPNLRSLAIRVQPSPSKQLVFPGSVASSITDLAVTVVAGKSFECVQDNGFDCASFCLPYWNKLRVLSIDFSPSVENLIRANAQTLESVTLQFCTSFIGAYEAISTCPYLARLSLRDAMVSEGDLELLSQCARTLRVLKLSNCVVGSEQTWLDVLPRFRWLNKIVLKGCDPPLAAVDRLIRETSLQLQKVSLVISPAWAREWGIALVFPSVDVEINQRFNFGS